MMSETTTTKKLKPPSEREYNRMATDLALEYCPMIYPCSKCKHPVISGYCCTFCGTSNPHSKDAAD
jgi:hypothetical protein